MSEKHCVHYWALAVTHLSEQCVVYWPKNNCEVFGKGKKENVENRPSFRDYLPLYILLSKKSICTEY